MYIHETRSSGKEMASAGHLESSDQHRWFVEACGEGGTPEHRVGGVSGSGTGEGRGRLAGRGHRTERGTFGVGGQETWGTLVRNHGHVVLVIHGVVGRLVAGRGYLDDQDSRSSQGCPAECEVEG